MSAVVARDILDTPRRVLERSDGAAALDLALRAALERYWPGETFLQVMAIRGRADGDADVRARTAPLVDLLEQQLLEDACPVIDAGAVMLRRRASADAPEAAVGYQQRPGEPNVLRLMRAM